MEQSSGGSNPPFRTILGRLHPAADRARRDARERGRGVPVATLNQPIDKRLNEGIDATTPAGKPQLHILAAIAEFERGRIRERVLPVQRLLDPLSVT